MHPVSHDWLEAEAQSFPFASEAAFQARLTRLCRNATGVLDGGQTWGLANDLENHLRPRAHGMSVELLRQLRDAAWFPPEVMEVALADHLGRLAKHYLELRGCRVALRADIRAAEQSARWRWLSLRLPADLMVAGLAATANVEPPQEHVQLVSPLLAPVLRHPCAETHLHVGAALSFSLLWTGLMRTLADAPPDPSRLEQRLGPAAPFGSGGRFLSILLAAVTSRLFLASFLRGPRAPGVSFTHFLNDGLSRICFQLSWGWGTGHARRECLRALELLIGRAKPAPLPLARLLYQRLLGPAPRGHDPDQPIHDVVRRDPLSAWLPQGPGLAFPESRFSFRALRYLLVQGRTDQVFARVFWQYQRVRCIVYRYLCEEPGTAGLDWFTRHYARISPLRQALDPAIYACALNVQSSDLHLESLEARTSPANTWIGVRDEVRALARQAARHRPLPERRRPEVGLVLHFIKEWEQARARPARLHADPRHSFFGCRYGAWFHSRRQQALAIATALRYHPEILLVLRGLDVANVELAQPTWLLPLLMAPVQREAAIAAARLGRSRPRWQTAPLRTTLHAGEDYRRLIEGLRRVHEPIECGLLRIGDRIGHGIALGEDVERMAAASASVTQPAEERLDDLLWELERYCQGDLAVDGGRSEFLRAQILCLGERIYSGITDITVENLLAARRLRHDPAALGRLGWPFVAGRVQCTLEAPPERLLLNYLTDAGVFARGQQPIQVTTDASELALLKAAQRWLRGVLGRMEITVESNPSSNLLIGDFLSVDDHPAFRLQPLPGREDPEGGPVLLSVNTDNPVTFASCLADEFAHIYYALLRKRIPAQDALRWLDQVRENGWRSRFTLAASSVAEDLDELLPIHMR